MYSFDFKNNLRPNLKYIQIIDKKGEEYWVTGISFDINTRAHIYLECSKNQPHRKYIANTIRSFLNNFGAEHTIMGKIIDDNVPVLINLKNKFKFFKNSTILVIYDEGYESENKDNKLKRTQRRK